ncbi:tRNA-dihydrouridine synthase [Candidatus Magnetomorum sp. HK-1]|nr:tRNA-dihydrouridine synthase [Candidatus Magnetomorum sp. HK-1]
MIDSQNKKIKDLIQRPLTIGNRTISNRLVFAPMSRLGHVAFRELLENYGHYGLLFSEMSSAKAIPHENRKVSSVFRWRDSEQDKLVWQILGGSPDEMAKAARRIEDEGFFGIDINFSCSMAYICKRGMGASLLKTPKSAIDIIKAVRASVEIPLWVKFRTGWSDSPEQAVDFARYVEDAGADAITFHPRIAPDRRTRPPKWAYISKIKQAVSIPVFGNGNVFDIDDCCRMFTETNCDGISLGRIAISKPWVFAEWNGEFHPDETAYRNLIKNYIMLLRDHYDPIRAKKRFLKFSKYFCAGFKFGNNLRSKIRKAETFSDIENVFEKFFDSPLLLNRRPNENLFV